MHVPYILTIWGPVLAIFILGLSVILLGGVVFQTIAFIIPVSVGLLEIMVLVSQRDYVKEFDSELLEVLQVQGLALWIVAGIFIVIIATIQLRAAKKKRMRKQKSALGIPGTA